MSSQSTGLALALNIFVNYQGDKALNVHVALSLRALSTVVIKKSELMRILERRH